MNPYIIKCMCANVGSPVVNIFLNMPDNMITATIFKFKIAAGYHVDSVTMSIGTRLHINLYI